MRNKMEPRSNLFSLEYIFIFSLCVLLVLGALSLAGCSAPAGTTSTNEQASSATEEQMEGSTVSGSITSIGDTELVIDATADSNEFLQGAVRVDLSQIDDDTVKSLKVGDTIKITYSSQVGMSEPPFISAITLEAVK